MVYEYQEETSVEIQSSTLVFNLSVPVLSWEIAFSTSSIDSILSSCSLLLKQGQFSSYLGWPISSLCQGFSRPSLWILASERSLGHFSRKPFYLGFHPISLTISPGFFWFGFAGLSSFVIFLISPQIFSIYLTHLEILPSLIYFKCHV
jgi:hypothetical protein